MLSILASVAVGVVVGVLSGMLGVGGGMMMIPVFRLGFAMQAIEATATSLFTIVPTSLAGCVTHLRNRTCVPAVGIAAGVGGAFASPLGAHLANRSPSWLIMLAAAAVISYSAFTMFKKALECRDESKRENAPSANPAPSTFGPVTRKQIGCAVAIGFAAGIASGYVGVGGGFIMVPLFISVLGVGMKKASGTSLIAVSILAVPGVATQLLFGNVLLYAGIAMAIGSIPGAVAGAHLAKRVPERILRFMFSGLLVLAAILLIAKELGW